MLRLRVPILVAESLRKSYGELTLLDRVDLSIHAGERVGLVGSNGAGKSTLARIVAGLEPPDDGRVATRREATVRYLSQEPDLPVDRVARDVVADGLGAWADAFRAHDALSERISNQEPGWESLLTAQAASAHEVERLGGWERSHQVDVLLEQLGMGEVSRPIGELSGGERRRVALAKLLVEEPSLAILDEPTNHLDADTIEWLEGYLTEQYGGALVLITHDRYVLDRVATRTLEIADGKIYSYDGGWQRYLAAKAERMAHASRAEANRQNLLRTELEWLRRSPKARTSKSKARVDRAVALRDAQGPRAERAARFELQTERLGGTVLEARGLTLELGGKSLVRGFDFVLQKGERIGIVGPNGAGKTTLLKALIGAFDPAEGQVIAGQNTKFAYFDQGRSGLDDGETLQFNVAEERSHVDFQGNSVDIRSYLKRFLFEPHRARDKVSALSGGERARAALAKMLLVPANVLMLDEPTNDLDVSTLATLEAMLVAGDSTALIVCHDRYFLDRVATGILAFEADGQVTAYAGNYSDYRANKMGRRRDGGARKGGDGAQASSTTPQAKPRKLSYLEKRELTEIVDLIETTEARAAEIEASLGSPALYTEHASDVPTLIEAQRETQEKLDQLMARWMELEAIGAGEPGDAP
ncbi:MAG: ABC-F family ATP-binding cassette domain-containing protein [Polyangiales bacterium]